MITISTRTTCWRVVYKWIQICRNSLATICNFDLESVGHCHRVRHSTCSLSLCRSTVQVVVRASSSPVNSSTSLSSAIDRVDRFRRRRSTLRPVLSSQIDSSTSSSSPIDLSTCFIVADRFIDQLHRRRSSRRPVRCRRSTRGSVSSSPIDSSTNSRRRRSTRRPGSSSPINSSTRFVVADRLVD